MMLIGEWVFDRVPTIRFQILYVFLVLWRMTAGGYSILP